MFIQRRLSSFFDVQTRSNQGTRPFYKIRYKFVHTYRIYFLKTL